MTLSAWRQFGLREPVRNLAASLPDLPGAGVSRCSVFLLSTREKKLYLRVSSEIQFELESKAQDYFLPDKEYTMAIYSTFFLCDPKQLQKGFPGWKLPLAEPVVRKSIDPFTRVEMTITTREPEWPDFDPVKMELPEYQVVVIDGDYATYLEQRIPPFIQSKPHWCSKNLTSVELEPLVAVAKGIEETRLEFALYAHPSLAAAIGQLPNDFVAHLKTADDSSLRAIAGKWAAMISTPEYTHSVSGKRLYDDWTVNDALSILMPIVELARQQTGGQSMYLLMDA